MMVNHGDGGYGYMYVDDKWIWRAGAEWMRASMSLVDKQTRLAED